MPMPEPTEIRVDEKGSETHESWLLIRANKVNSTGTFLFDSELPHTQFVTVTISRCCRERTLKNDRLFSTTVLVEFDLSLAQWGAFVSSFGDGAGVPATLTFLAGDGRVAPAVHESRLAVSHAEVRKAADEALAEIQEAFGKVEALFDGKAGRRELGQAMRDLHFKLANAPANMVFAAKSLTTHSENVVAKARADVEGMLLSLVDGNPELAAGLMDQLQLGTGEDA
jgi:hypothetical protein